MLRGSLNVIAVRGVMMVLMVFISMTSAKAELYLKTGIAKLTNTAQSGINVDYSKYFIQCNGRITSTWRKSICNTGAKILRYVPDNAYLISVDQESLSKIKSDVSYLGLLPYHSQYKVDLSCTSNKIQSETSDGTNKIYSITLFDKSVRDSYVERINQLSGCRVLKADGGVIRAELTDSCINEISSWDEVEYISPYVPSKLSNDKAVGSNRMNVVDVWPGGGSGLGLTGKNQIVAVADTGLDTGDKSTLHEDVRGRVLRTYALSPYSFLYGWSDLNGHGTHVVGSVLGNGANSSSPKIRGTAYEASLIFQSIGPDGNLSGIPADLNNLFAQAYDSENDIPGARIHSNSWGAPVDGGYNEDSKNLDKFMFDHPDMLIVVAAGNDGGDLNNDGVVDKDSMEAPGTAKNCLTVGASENCRTSGGYAENTWLGFDFSTDPIKSDKISAPYKNNTLGMAAFSSRGPCDDGRIKPDIVAPGTDILSMRSSKMQKEMWGPYNDKYIYCGGTSMATPLVSGSVALLRQWLSEKKGLSSPQAATLKALVCAGACSLAPGQYGTGSYREIPSTYPNNVEGWGEVNIGNSVGSGSSEPMVYDKQVICESEVHTYKVKVSSGGGKLTIIMAYTDAPSALVSSKNLVNDLDVKVITPSGQELYPNSMNSPDRINNMEGIRISNAEAGIYTITVTAYNIVTPMSYSLTGMDGAVLYSLVGCGDYLGGASYGEDEPDDPQPEYHFVAFYPQNGESVIKKEMYTVGASYGEFPEFKYDGYEFVGWFTEPEGGIQIYETDIVTKEFAKLYAQWRVEKKYIAVSFDANGGSVYPSSYQYIIGDLYENLPTPTYIDHIFKGWYTRQSGGTLVTEDSIVSESVSVLYAHWEIVQRDFPNFSFVTPVGWDSSVFISKSRASDSVSTLYAGQEFFINIAYKNTGTLDAINIGKVSYSIECNDSGMELISGTHTGSYKLSIGEIEKFNTVPYFLNEPGSYTLTVILNSDGTIEESDYTDNRQTYSFVVLPSDDNGGGDGNGDGDSGNGDGGGDSGIPNFTFEKPSDWPAAVFLSKERAVGMSKVFRPNENIYVNWAYLANGIENPKECDVHIAVIDSKTGEEWYSLDYSASGSVVVSGGACRFSHDFSLYWEGEYRLSVLLNPSKTIKETDYTDNEYSIDFSIKEDIVRWNVSFNAAGGSLVGDSIRIVNDGDAVGVLPMPTREGYAFLGWFTVAEGGEQVTADTLVTGDMTLYAQWGLVESLTVSASLVVADDSGKSGLISITANCDWSVSASKSWIIASPLSGNGNDTISYTILENDLDSSRSGEIVVSSLGGIRRVISVFQEAKIEKQGNDNFVNAILLSGESGSISASNIGATFENEEPKHIYPSVTTSVWWKWKPSKSGFATFSTVGSSFDTILAVYTGTTLSSLIPYASDDQSGGNNTSICSFEVVAGTTYYIAVAGYNGETGTIELSWDLVVSGQPVFTIEDNVLRGVELNGVTDVEIPNGVIIIGNEVFSQCEALTSVVIPNSVTMIGEYAFRSCSSLTNVVLGTGLTTIERGAFHSCTSLLDISLPQSLKTIEGFAFAFCSSLQEVFIPENVETIGEGAFGGCDGMKRFVVDESNCFYSASNGCLCDKQGVTLIAGPHGLAEVQVPVGVTNIATSAFWQCDILEKITFPNSLKSIQQNAFQYCDNLDNVILPSSITYLESWAFQYCSSLANVRAHISSKELIESRSVFSLCSSKLSIVYYCTVNLDANGGVLSDNLQDVDVGVGIGALPTPTKDGYTFLGWFTAAEGGEQVTADSVVTADMALYAHWEAVTIEPQWTIDENGVLTRVELNGATEVAIPSNVKVIGDSVFSGYMLTKVTIPEGVGSIGNMAFQCCLGLTEIKIPSSITNIGESAFYGCNDLRKVEGGTNLERVGMSAFWDTSFLYGEDSWESVQTNEYYTTGRGLKLVYVGSFIVDHVGYLSESSDEKYYDENGNWTWEYDLALREGTTGIADYLFPSLPITSVTIPGSVKRIPENVFQNCRNLKNLIINEGVEEIGKYAFSYAGCNLEEDVITTLTIPSSVVKIGEYAFADFGYLKYVIGLDDTDDISGDAFIWTPYVEGWYSPSLMIEDGVVYGLLEELRFDDGCITNGTLYIPGGVTNIATSAFNGSSEFCNVNLPDTLQSIGDNAFSSSSLTNVIIPASVQRVGYWAFDGCGESLYDKASIPGVILVDGWAVCYTESLSGWLNLSGVSGIGKGAFNGCDSLTGVTIPDGVTCIDSDAFSCCSSLMGAAIPDSVTSIEGYAFYGCSSLAGVTIPSGVTKIGYLAFGGCERLERIRIPDGVKYVGVDAFANCTSLHTVTVPQLLCGWYSGSDEFSGDFEYNNLSTVMYCGSLTNLVIATGVTNIADGVFSGLCSLMGVTIPSSVTDIGRDVFNCCCSLENIIIPNGVTNIGPYAFSNCYSLRWVTIPDSVTHIGSMAFYSCYNLESLRIPDGITYIGHDAFGGCTALKSVTVPQLLCGWYSSSDEWEGDFQYSNLSSVMYCGSLTNLVIAAGVTNIADNVFSSCDSLIGVTIPNSVVSIGAGAFAYCGFESVSIPDGVLSISADAFYGCSRLVDVTISDSVKSVCASAFWGCNDLLYDVTTLPGVQLVDGWAVGYDSLLPECLSLNGVRGVASEAFWYCDSLVGVTIPDGVKSVCASAFYGCSSLENVVFSGDISYVGACAFWECGLLGKVSVPQLLCGIYSNDGFNDGDGSFTYNHLSDVINCGSLTNLVLASGVTNIEERVFSYCGSLQEITISDSVVNIGNYVFEGCYSLNSIYIPESVENIGKYAFANCYNLMYAKIPLVLKNQIEEGNVFDGCPEDMRIDYYEILPLLAPVITPADGTEFYEDSCAVTITCETEGASIYYTTDGTTPRPRPVNLYTEPFEVTDTTTIKAIAVKGDERTDPVSATIVKKEIVLAEPVITPTDGTEFYEDSCMVTISCATEGASIYYTTDGTTPRTRPANLYTESFDITGSVTVKSIAVLGNARTDVVSATFIKRELTLPIAVDAPTLEFTTGGDAQWLPVRDTSAKIGGSVAQSGVITASENYPELTETWMETSVSGSGTFSFWWKVDCEHDYGGNCTFDRLEVYTNGVEVARIDGKTEWAKMEFTFADSGTHTIRWRFCKDDWDDDKLTDLAWVDGVVWTPASTDITVDVGDGKSVVVPTEWIDRYEGVVSDAGGDKAAALQRTAANGRKVWECFMLGVDPTKADDDFRITRFWMENGKPMFEYSHTSDGAGRSFVSRIRKLGTQTLDDPWQEVPSEGNPLFRFFTVEVQLP